MDLEQLGIKQLWLSQGQYLVAMWLVTRIWIHRGYYCTLRPDLIFLAMVGHSVTLPTAGGNRNEYSLHYSCWLCGYSLL